MTEHYDLLIIGGGAFGLYAAILGARKGLRTCIVEADHQLSRRASFINQARVHQGYHYPRSILTARSSIRFYRTFIDDFTEAINGRFEKIYAISRRNSFTPHRQFSRFCQHLEIPAREVDPGTWFNPGTVESTYVTEECSFDGIILGRMLEERARASPLITINMGCRPQQAEPDGNMWKVQLEDGRWISAGAAINATYSSLNVLQRMFHQDEIPLKHEMCELILVKAGDLLSASGITVMDGPFFSLMPFGLHGVHSLTAVDFTPHQESRESSPRFPCQERTATCRPDRLQNCNSCPEKPSTAFAYMAQLARKYLIPKLEFTYERSLFTVKTTLRASETDDSRPTLIRKSESGPRFASVLSGKINTIYELEDLIHDFAH